MRGWPHQRAWFNLGRWGKIVNLLALIYGGLMIINIGLWADSDLVAQWLLDSFGVAQFREILPEAAAFEVSRYPLPNLRAVNFVVHGILGWGVASNLRLDTQAKGLAELLRSRPWPVPPELVSTGPPAERLAALDGAGRARFDREN